VVVAADVAARVASVVRQARPVVAEADRTAAAGRAAVRAAVGVAAAVAARTAVVVPAE
jgi:hypothetical protein